MSEQESPQSSNQENSEAKKSNAFINALLIGFLFGIILFSIFTNSLGWFTLIPLFLIYKLVNSPKKE